MSGDSILGVSISTTKITGSRPVVPDTIFNHPVSAFEVIPARVAVMSESRNAPNIFWFWLCGAVRYVPRTKGM